ncbi:MAG: cell surface protein SprA, partial [Tannerellaceae bacterium]
MIALICLLTTVLGGEGVLCAQTWSDSIKTVDSLYTRALFNAYALKQYREMRDSAFSAAVLPKQLKLKSHEKWFGPGKLKAKLQGRAEASLGVKYINYQNPDLPYNSRKRIIPEFDENIELSFDGSLGEKLKMKTHFTTELFNEKTLNNLYLGYTGYEDEIIRYVEAGNVNLFTENKLINSTSSLFGIKAGIQLGPLTVDFLAASESSTVVLHEEGGRGHLSNWELEIDRYDENRHFFLSHFFRSQFTDHVRLAFLNRSPLLITRIEVWITNTQGVLEDSRHIAAISQLGDLDNQYDKPEMNEGSLLYQQLINSGSICRNVDNPSELQSLIQYYNADCEVIRKARRLRPEEYDMHSALGYLSLKHPLKSYEQLAVSFEYAYKGQTYRVGEWSDLSEIPRQEAIFARLLKSEKSAPSHYTWKLMMKNVYKMPEGGIEKQDFEFDVLVRREDASDYTPFLEQLGTKTLLQILQLDRVGPNNRNGPDGRFDYVEDVTILSDLGCIVFPMTEPFGDYLLKNTTGSASSYTCQALYDSTLIKARSLLSPRQILMRGKSKLKQRGIYKLKNDQLSSGSLLVKVQDKELIEHVDYTIDRDNNILTIINEEYLQANVGISISTNQSSFLYGNRQTRLGLNLNYVVNRNLSLGASWMMVQAKPRFDAYASAEDFVSNMIYGLHSRYAKSWKTRVRGDSIQALNSLVWNTDVAFLVSGAAPKNAFLFIDDFEANHITADLSQPLKWSLSSIPMDGILFEESLLSNRIETGFNRALINWYTIEPSFVKPGSKYLPEYLRYNKEELSHHYVRSIHASELFPNRDVDDTDQRYISSFNLSFYPNERGPYNLDASEITPEGFLLHPHKRWGGIMRSIEASDFETQQVQYLEFWLLDPFLYSSSSQGGTLSIDL